ncbi:MAG: 30S ribosomal protein S1 [Lentisphaeria bacterium]|nr:30S ribosomal protein S1 [Lentisphaeria bacterium]
MAEKLNLVEDGGNFVDLGSITSMEDALQASNISKDFTRGKIRSGKIVSIRPDGVLVDIGYKAEGFVPASEFSKFDELTIGTDIDVLLEEVENENSMPTLSHEKAESMKTWDRITKEYGEGYVLKGIMRHRVKGGIMVDIEGFQAFLPGSQLDIGQVLNMDDYIGKEFDVKIIKINLERRNIVVSRREILAESLREKRVTLLKTMTTGELRKGVVKNITEFGAFIDLGGVDGLLHITDISWGRVSHPSEVLTVGQEIEVMILNIDEVKERVSLGLKQKQQNPWDDIVSKYPVGSKVTGKVVNIMPYGAFVELESGVEGLIHVTEMSWTKRISKPGDVLSAGQEVEAVVLDVDVNNRKISLGLRQKERNPWEVLAEKYPVGSRVHGKVRNMTTFGAFVEIENDIDGMIHVTDMSWTRKINNPNEVLKPGQEVDAVILDINPELQRVSLGLKQAESDPWANIDAMYKVGDVVRGKVTKIAQFGAFVELTNKIDGLIHISQLSRDHVAKVRDVLNEGDEVEARVIKVNPEARQIGLSVKAVEDGFTEDDMKEAEAAYTQPLKAGEGLGEIGGLLDGLDIKE